MTIDVYNTHIEVYPYIKGDIPVIEQMYTAQDKFSGNDFPCGYLIDGGKLYLPRGTSISKLEDVTGVKATYHGKSDEFDYMSKEHSSYYDPRNELQEQSIAFLEDRTNGNQLSLNLITGFGKGNPLSMKIPCPYAPSGYKCMGDIHPDDSVFGADGKPTKVLQVFPLGMQDIYRVYFSDGRYSDCTDEHLWNVFEDDNVVKTMTTLDLISLYKDHRFHVSLCKPVEYPHQDVVIDPYTMGTQLAPISDTAYIPREYMYTDSNSRMELLRGLLSIDSSKSFMQPDNITYKTCSENLLPQIRELALGLGYIVDAGVFHGYCVIQLIKPDNAYIDIIDIKKVRREEAQCILVDTSDHLYLAEDFIVTHNTYCVAAAVTKLSIKALIITPNDGLKLQWMYKTFRKMFDYQESDLCNISGSAVMNSIMEDKVEPADVYFVNHQTLQSFLSQNNGYQLQQFFKKIKVGIKVYDESHLDFGNILLMDFFSNTDRTWYLTATFDRSDKSESACFKRAFQNVIPFGEAESKAIKRKHVIYHTVNITSNISPRDKAILLSYPGFNAVKYGKYALFTDKNDTVYRTILNILKKTENVEGKTLIFVPLIEGVDEIVKKLKRDFPQKSVTAYHSKMPKDEKEEGIVKKDIIVSTIKSCGTGKDIPGLRTLICAEPIASKVVTEQLLGRLREYAPDKDTYFWDIVDRSIPPLTWWHRSRIKKIESLAKQIVNLSM